MADEYCSILALVAGNTLVSDNRKGPTVKRIAPDWADKVVEVSAEEAKILMLAGVPVAWECDPYSCRLKNSDAEDYCYQSAETARWMENPKNIDAIFDQPQGFFWIGIKEDE